MDDGTLDDSASEEPVGQVPPAGGALRLVRTYAPNERNQLDALRLLARELSCSDLSSRDSSPDDSSPDDSSPDDSSPRDSS